MMSGRNRNATRKTARRANGRLGLAMLLLATFLPPIASFAMIPPCRTQLSTIQSSLSIPRSDSSASILSNERCLASGSRFKSKRQARISLSVTPSATIASNHQIGAISMLLLCVQFAFQPVLTRTYASKSIQRGTYVLMQDVVRIIMSVVLLNQGLLAAAKGWTIGSALQAAGIPSMLYLVQNICSLMAYQHLSPITYNVLNQTKTLSAAIFCYFLLGQKQSPQQMVALLLLVLAALIMEGSLGKLLSLAKPSKEKKSDSASGGTSDDAFWTGDVPVLVASTTSGLAGALAQKSLQLHARNAMVFNMELAACSIAIMTGTKVVQRIIKGLGFESSSIVKETETNNNAETEIEEALSVAPKSAMWIGWTKQTWIPLMTNAAGGVLVGLVTKYAGAVQKGFSLILGMFLSGLLQNYMSAGKGSDAGEIKTSKRVTTTQWLGGALAAVSLILHVSYPPTG